MDDLTTDEICDKCGNPISILISDFEQAVKDNLPILCSDCHEISLNEQMDNPPSVVFKYRIAELGKIQDFDILNKAGAEGWELIAVDNGQAYFKQEYYHEET